MKAVPGGTGSFSPSFIVFGEKINIGGIKKPPAEVQITAVVETPRSAETILPTCFLPLLAKILQFLPGIVLTDVSSTLKILCG